MRRGSSHPVSPFFARSRAWHSNLPKCTMHPIIGWRGRVEGMRYRGVALSRGLVFFCITFLLVLGLFVVPAEAQTDDPMAGQTAFIDVTNDDIVNAIGPVAVAGCTVARDATIVVADEDETQVELVNGQNAQITGWANAITIEGTGANGTLETPSTPTTSSRVRSPTRRS